jgi:hypothetical protein
MRKVGGGGGVESFHVLLVHVPAVRYLPNYASVGRLKDIKIHSKATKRCRKQEGGYSKIK